MECLEFKRLALSDPNSKEISFVKHAEECPCCLKYIGGVREMDMKLADSLAVDVPNDLMARLELNQLLDQDRQRVTNFRQYAKVAGFAMVMFVSGFMLKDLLSSNQNATPVVAEVTAINANQVSESEDMIVKLVNHMERNPMTPIWDAALANKTMKTLMASYDPTLKLKDMARLQFMKICPLDKDTRALHANLETDHGQITFAYIKGHPVGEVSNNSYKGYLTRIKPIRGGSLVILSQNMYAMEEAAVELDEAMYWDI